MKPIVGNILVKYRDSDMLERLTSGDDHSTRPNISAEGRVLTFRSYVTNLVPNNTNGELDIFGVERDTGGMELITRGCDSRKQTRMIDLCLNDLA